MKLGLDKKRAEVGRQDQTTYTYAYAGSRGMNVSVVSLLTSLAFLSGVDYYDC